MVSLRVAVHTVIPTTIGAIVTAMGQSGRLRSCSITSMMAMARGKTVKKSNKAPVKKTILISSTEVR